MVSIYTPDRWVLVKTPKCYRVFGTWSGGYLAGHSWRFNSGITKIVEHSNFYEFLGYSGSIYRCGKDSYGYDPYGWSVLYMYKDQGVTVLTGDVPDLILSIQGELEE